EPEYFTDLGKGGELSRSAYLKNQLQAAYNGQRWRFSGAVQHFQTLSGVEPYQRAPQLKLALKPSGKNSVNLIFTNEYNYFDSDERNIIGSRSDHTLGLSYPYTSTATFITPTIKWRTTQYSTEDKSASTTSDYERSLPIFSLDSGLFLERQVFNNGYTQTLEPRLYYLNVPYRDQSAIPVFDTSERRLSFGQLFSDSRFNGADRIGDSQQLSIAVSSRFLSNQDGKERFTAKLGQILYFADRQVQLPGITTDNTAASEYAAELSSVISQSWNWKGTILWAPETEKTHDGAIRLQYKPDSRHIFNADYRLRTNETNVANNLHQYNLSGFWKLNPKWQLFGRYQFDRLKQLPLEVLAGFGYESCCWAVRLMHREILPAGETETSSSLLFEFEFKGLASVNGKRLNNYLKDGILGYQP
ncbi:MAG: LPS assembly protein LptD, partial [Gammaproteobacteria bacterium]|nr:LPS assembly protein LptD [Gammaproteobacteria bacterium]